MDNWFKIEFVFAKNTNIDPLILDQLEFYRVEYLIQNYEESIEEENKQYEKYKKENEASISKTKHSTDFKQMKMPKMEIPKINYPTPKL